MTAEELVDEYMEVHGLSRITQDQYAHMRTWMERSLRKRMPRPFFITRGSGGGQRYRLWWLIFDVLGNRNTPAYFYTDMTGITVDYLVKNGHLPLQAWIDDDSPELKF